MRLKKYHTYLRRVHKYARSVGTKIKRKPYIEGVAEIDTRTKTIWLDAECDDSDTIANILHELGHLLDDSYEEIVTPRSALNRAYINVYAQAKDLTRLQKAAVLRTEARAWRYGKAIAKLLRIPLGKWYNIHRAEGLNSYRSLKTKD